MHFYSQHGTIIRALQSHEKLDSRFFQRGHYFVGYKFPQRVNELVHKGMVETAGELGKYKLYRLTEKGVKMEIKKPTILEFLKHQLGMHVS